MTSSWLSFQSSNNNFIHWTYWCLLIVCLMGHSEWEKRKFPKISIPTYKLHFHFTTSATNEWCEYWLTDHRRRVIPKGLHLQPSITIVPAREPKTIEYERGSTIPPLEESNARWPTNWHFRGVQLTQIFSEIKFWAPREGTNITQSQSRKLQELIQSKRWNQSEMRRLSTSHHQP